MEQPWFLCVFVCVCVSFCLLFYIFVYILIFLVLFKSYWDHRNYIINKIESIIALSAMNMRYSKCLFLYLDLFQKHYFRLVLVFYWRLSSRIKRLIYKLFENFFPEKGKKREDDWVIDSKKTIVM